MATFPAADTEQKRETLVEQVKAHYSIAPFVAPHTRGLKPSGPGWYIGRCPFHQAATDPPGKRKFWVNVGRGICGCFVPRCPAHSPPLDVINFHARLTGQTNREALLDLAERAGLIGGNFRGPI